MAACDAYSIRRLEVIPATGKAMQVGYFLKFAMFKGSVQMDTQELCPICGEGHVTAQVQEIESDYKSHKAIRP